MKEFHYSDRNTDFIDHIFSSASPIGENFIRLEIPYLSLLKRKEQDPKTDFSPQSNQNRNIFLFKRHFLREIKKIVLRYDLFTLEAIKNDQIRGLSLVSFGI